MDPNKSPLVWPPLDMGNLDKDARIEAELAYSDMLESRVVIHQIMKKARAS